MRDKQGNLMMELFCPETDETIENKYNYRKNRYGKYIDEEGVEVKNQRMMVERDEKGEIVDRTGVVRVGTKIFPGDIIVGQTFTKQNKQGETIVSDCSVVVKKNEDGIVDKVHIDILPSGYKLVKIIVRKLKIPEPGDKVAARSAQKGTMGIVMRQEDMPFTASGMVPDLVMNPLAFPSRMTINQIMELTLGKVCALSGKYGDCTPFTPESVNRTESICEELHSLGFQQHGQETLYSGTTGEMLHASIYMGPTYYQRLKHMVGEKMHCLTLDHEVLTKEGWKFYPELKTSDEIACLNEKGELTYSQPTALHYYPHYSGEMYNVETGTISLNVTANHRMYVKMDGNKHYSLEYASDLVGVRSRYKRGSKYISPDLTITFPEIIGYYGERIEEKTLEGEEMTEFLRMYGMWVGGGGVNHLSSWIVPSLMKLGVKFEYISLSSIAILDNQILTFFQYSPATSLPDWTLKLSAKQARTLIDAMMVNGVERIGVEEGGLYSTHSKFIDRFQQLCLHAGWTADVKCKNYDGGEGGSGSGGDGSGGGGPSSGGGGPSSGGGINIYRAVVKKYMTDLSPVFDPAISNVHSDNIYTTENTPVFCVTVPTEIFYVRRNGVGVWTGNSRLRGQVTMLNRQPLAGRSREGGLRFGEISPKWYGNILLVCGMAGDTIKFRGRPKASRTNFGEKFSEGLGENSRVVITVMIIVGWGYRR